MDKKRPNAFKWRGSGRVGRSDWARSRGWLGHKLKVGLVVCSRGCIARFRIGVIVVSGWWSCANCSCARLEMCVGSCVERMLCNENDMCSCRKSRVYLIRVRYATWFHSVFDDRRFSTLVDAACVGERPLSYAFFASRSLISYKRHLANLF